MKIEQSQIDYFVRKIKEAKHIYLYGVAYSHLLCQYVQYEGDLFQKDILVLDDCSSALDYATDAALQKQLQELKEMTKIIISQRTASLKRCDRIMVLYHGELVGFDSHEQLLKDCQVYQEIYESQNSKEGETNG